MSTTWRTTTLRRRLLQGVVEENLATLNGQPFRTVRRARRRRAARVRRVLLTVVAIVVGSTTLAALMVRMEPSKRSFLEELSVATDRAPGPITVPASPPDLDDIIERLGVSEPEPLVPAVIPVRVGRVALDPGHGGIDGGTSMGYGLLEKDLTKDITNRLAALLTDASWEVVVTREGDDSVSLKQRADIANAASADVFLSIHVNWLPDRTARGFETYYLGPTDDPFLKRLAAIENRESGFALSDYRDVLQKIYADVRHVQSRDLAHHIQRRLFEALRHDNPDIVSRGVMTAPFAVLVTTEMPAVLVEVACLSNDREARLLALPGYRQRIAGALFDAITAYARSVNTTFIAAEKGS